MKIHLVIGGSSSGKSEYAENLLLEAGAEEKYYIATMVASDDDAVRRVRKHRQARAGKGFVTIEQPRDIGLAAGQINSPGGAAILECMSNLVANEMFWDGMVTWDDTVDKIISGLRILAKSLEEIIIVTNNVFCDGWRYDENTTRYIYILGKINALLAAEAESVTEVVAGIPVPVK